MITSTRSLEIAFSKSPGHNKEDLHDIMNSLSYIFNLCSIGHDLQRGECGSRAPLHVPRVTLTGTLMYQTFYSLPESHFQLALLTQVVRRGRGFVTLRSLSDAACALSSFHFFKTRQA